MANATYQILLDPSVLKEFTGSRRAFISLRFHNYFSRRGALLL